MLLPRSTVLTLLALLLGCAATRAQAPVEITLGVAGDSREFVVNIVNDGKLPLDIPIYQGMPLTLGFEIWAFETGVRARPKVVQALSEGGAFAPLTNRVLNPGEKWTLNIKWEELTAGLEESRQQILHTFSHAIHQPDAVSARAFLEINEGTKAKGKPTAARFESAQEPVHVKKPKDK